MLLENWYLFGEHIKRAPGKLVSVRRTDHILLENLYLFGNRQTLPGKLASVRWTHKASWKTPEKGFPGRKEQIFSKIVSVAASEHKCSYASNHIHILNTHLCSVNAPADLFLDFMHHYLEGSRRICSTQF